MATLNFTATKINELLSAADSVVTMATITSAVAGSVIKMNGAKITYTGQNFFPADITVEGPGEFIAGADDAFIRLGARNIVEGVTFTGTLTDKNQFSLAVNGIASYFAAPTYQDNARVVLDGSDFTHTLATNTLTVGMPAPLTAQLSRFVVSSLITLNSTKNYGIWIDEDFAAGNGATTIQFWICDSAGNELSQYFPSASSGAFVYLSTAAYLKIKVGCSRSDHTKVNLTSTFDLSKIKIYEGINHLATLPAVLPAQYDLNYGENRTNVNCYTNDTLVKGCLFRYHKFAAMKIVGDARTTNLTGRRNRIIDCVVEYSVGGFTSQDGYDNEISKNTIDLSFLDGNNNKVPSGIIYRNHCVSFGNQEIGSNCSHNTMLGASWAFEQPSNLTVKGSHSVCSHNTIECVHTGVSMTVANSMVDNNTIRLSSVGSYGIEMSHAAYSRCCNNTIWQKSPATATYGITCSGDQTQLEVSNNSIRANVGIYCTGPTADPVNQNFGLTLLNNTINYWTIGVYTSTGGTTIKDNIIKAVSRFAMLGQTYPGSGIWVTCGSLPSYTLDNLVEGGGAYCYFNQVPQTFEVVNNDFWSFTAAYTDVYINISTTVSTLAKIAKNTVRNKSSRAYGIQGATPFTGSIFRFDENFSETNSTYNLESGVNNLAITFLVSSNHGANILYMANGVTAPSADTKTPATGCAASGRWPPHNCRCKPSLCCRCYRAGLCI